MPPKVPTEILRKRGSWRAKLRVDEPQVEVGRPEPSGQLTGLTLELWDAHCERLSNVLTPLDGGALERYCALSARWQQLEAVDVSAFDLSEAEERRHMRTVRWLSEHLLKLEKEYGMTPSSRAHVAAGPRREPVLREVKAKTRWLTATPS